MYSNNQNYLSNQQSHPQGRAQFNGQDTSGWNPNVNNSSRTNSVSNVNAGTNEPNSNYRPHLSKRFFPSNRSFKATPNRYKFKKARYTPTASNGQIQKSTKSPSVDENPRNKGFTTVVLQRGTDNVKSVLMRICDDTGISLKMIRCIGFHQPLAQHLKIFMCAREKSLYEKIAQKVESVDEKILANQDNIPFTYYCPLDLSTPLKAGEVFASVTTNNSLFSLKLSKEGTNRFIIEALDLLVEWQNTRYPNNPFMIEESVASIRISNEDMYLSFHTEQMKVDFMDFTSRCSQYVAVCDTRATSILVSQGTLPRKSLKISPDMVEMFRMLGKMTPQMLQWCQMMGTGKYAIVEISEDMAVENATKMMNGVSMTSAMDTDDPNTNASNLQAPIIPISK